MSEGQQPLEVPTWDELYPLETTRQQLAAGALPMTPELMEELAVRWFHPPRDGPEQARTYTRDELREQWDEGWRIHEEATGRWLALATPEWAEMLAELIGKLPPGEYSPWSQYAGLARGLGSLATSLARILPAAVVAYVTPLLDDAPCPMRQSLFVALGFTRLPEARPPLLRMLERSDLKSADLVAIGLALAQIPTAAEELAALLRKLETEPESFAQGSQPRATAEQLRKLLRLLAE